MTIGGRKLNGEVKWAGIIVAGAAAMFGVDYAVKHALGQIERVPIIDTKLAAHLEWSETKSESIDRSLTAIDAKIDVLATQIGSLAVELARNTKPK